MTNLTSTGGVPGPGRIGRVAIGDLLKRAAVRFPDRIALTDGARRVTFTELEHDANRFANYLVARGLKPGAKIATICNNSIEFVKALFGIHRAGLVWVPINTMLGAADMDYILGHAEVGFALIDDNLHAQPDRRAARFRRSPIATRPMRPGPGTPPVAARLSMLRSLLGSHSGMLRRTRPGISRFPEVQLQICGSRFARPGMTANA